MKCLVDIVNFNPDASCLSSQNWISFLNGGRESRLFEWLNLYVKYGRKVVLGFTGSSISDITRFNPEAITLINENSNIFEILLRPFSHDVALLRGRLGFVLNYQLGRKALEKSFRNISPFYLPPEFMVTAEQIYLLSLEGVRSVFINSDRMRDSSPNDIPCRPYWVKGIFDTRLPCIPVAGKLVRSYLRTLQLFDREIWNQQIMEMSEENVYFWRDGESSFLLPQGNFREEFWLKSEGKKINRVHLSEVFDDQWAARMNEAEIKLYPLHPFSAWFREFRLMGFMRRMFTWEKTVGEMGPCELGLWMYAITSDVLSAVEKRSPIIKLRDEPQSDEIYDFTLHRTERHVEGEEVLSILEEASSEEKSRYLRSEVAPHLKKINARIGFLSSIFDRRIRENREVSGGQRTNVDI